MKFKLLSIGQKFKYQNEVYVKASPIVASNVETGHNKMIPAYAALTLLDNTSEDVQTLTKEPLVAEEILDAFNLFYGKCIATLEKNNILVPVIKDEFDKARDEFIEKLIK
ncbi:MAG: hypothetical protein OQK75_04110 [Gammaproteobacteria bacterium]|nr:hypothetical protein [Gammaproteobacteria bacterium]MCW8986834.1 hypothetical protein [Gammaproteobacteria bacterium]MCW9032083.1 hypothetical protein [Gammaproteobacteria bacterium]